MHNQPYSNIDTSLYVLHILKTKNRYMDTIKKYKIHKASEQYLQHILSEKTLFESNLL